jgi:YHS domain-containing protein
VTRVLLIFLLLCVVGWALSRFMSGVIDVFGGVPNKNARRRGGGGPPPVKLVRDPSCGTWVDPKASLAIQAGGSVYHFCSSKCRDEFKRSP